MNRKISATEFRDLFNRYASELKADPRRAQRIIAAEKGERKMKKKWTVSLAFVLLIMLGLAGAAYGVTSLCRVVGWRGEVTRTVEPVEMPEAPDEKTAEKESKMGMIGSYLQEVPDDETVFAWYDDGTNEMNIYNCDLHKAVKNTNSIDEFLEWMSSSAMTLPSWLPEEVHDKCTAMVLMDCKAYGHYEELERSYGEDFNYTRFRIDEASKIPTEYLFGIDLEDGRSYMIHSYLRPSQSEEATGLLEGETVEKVTVKGMDDALLIRRNEAYSPVLIMRRQMDEPVAWKRLPIYDGLEEDDNRQYCEEYVSVFIHNGDDIREALKFFSAE